MPFLVFIIMCVVIIAAVIRGVVSYYDTPTWPEVVTVILALLLGVGWLWQDYDQIETRTIIVEGKDRGGDSGSYRIYTDSDTLVITDVWFDNEYRRTNSADFFGDIPVCHELVVETRGWEAGALDMMPNIVAILSDRGPVEGCTPSVGG